MYCFWKIYITNNKLVSDKIKSLMCAVWKNDGNEISQQNNNNNNNNNKMLTESTIKHLINDELP